jgi:hypothetical protein
MPDATTSEEVRRRNAQPKLLEVTRWFYKIDTRKPVRSGEW